MPTYVYKFTDTGETIEVQQAFTDDALTEVVHPKTGATMQVKKVFLPVGVTFRGGGFYKTDSRGPGAKKKSGATDTGADKTSSDTSSSDKSSSDKSSSDKSSSSSEGNGSSTPSTPATTSSTSKD